MVSFTSGELEPQLRLLGAPCLDLGKRIGNVQLPSKAYALIALLILEFRGSVRRSVLASRLWEDASEDNALGNLRQLLSRIRKVESAHSLRLLVVNDTTIACGPSCVRSDLGELLSMSKIDNMQVLRRVFTIHHGDLLHGVPLIGPELQNWLSTSRQYVSDYFIHLVIAGSQTVEAEQANWVLRRLFNDFAYDDRTCRALMQHLAKHNNWQEACLVYEKFWRELASNFDTTPEPETNALYRSFHANTQAAPQLSTQTYKQQPQLSSDSPNALNPQQVMETHIPRLTLLKPQISGTGVPALLGSIANSFVEDITLNLCRLRSIAVIAPYSAWQMSENDVLAEAKKHQIDYAVQFFIHAGWTTHSSLRMSLQFTNTTTMEVLWSEEFELKADSPGEFFRALAIEIASRLTNHIDYAEILTLKRTNVTSAYRHYLVGRDQLQVLNLPNLRRARKSFRSATELSSHFAPALSSSARTLILEWVLLARDDKELLREAQAMASRAIEADPFDGSGHREYGRSCLFLGQLDEAIHHGELGEQYAPHHADVLADLADTFVHSSDMDKAKRHIHDAIKLNPLPPDEYLWTGGGIEFFLGNYEQALNQLLRMRNYEPAFRLMSACAAMSGQVKLAKDYRHKTLSVHPDFRIDDWISRMPQRDPAHLEHYVTALRVAGFE